MIDSLYDFPLTLNDLYNIWTKKISLWMNTAMNISEECIMIIK
jgi:hypothetical protein